MSFVRPEARDVLWRWREVATGVVMAGVGIWWVLGLGGILHWLGYVVLLLAGAVLFMGVQRARFRHGGGGPGVVRVDEGQVAYFGPLTGGVVAIRDLDSLTLDPSGHPAHWVPTLPGLRTEHMLAQMQRLPDFPTVIWQKAPPLTSSLRLH